MKVLNDKTYDVLKRRADAFDSIVSHMVEAGTDVSAEDITADVVLAALNADPATDETDLAAAVQVQLDAATDRVEQLETELATANQTIADLEERLDGEPAADPATITASSETDGKEFSMAEFADKNKGNTTAILEKAKAEGFI